MLASAAFCLALTVLPLRAAAPAGPAAPAAPASKGKELFDESVASWKEVRTRRLLELRALVKALKGQPPIVAGLWEDWARDLDRQSVQLGLARTLKENQDQAAADGVIDAARRDLHKARLDRLLSERLLLQWGNSVPARWNFRLEGVVKTLKVPGYPFPVYPSQKEYDAYSTKDFVPVYEKGEKRMKTVGLEEPAVKP